MYWGTSVTLILADVFDISVGRELVPFCKTSITIA